MKKPVIFEGSAIAIVTPFTEDLKKIDYAEFEKIINHPALAGLPMILETPNELPGYAREIALLRSLEK